MPDEPPAHTILAPPVAVVPQAAKHTVNVVMVTGVLMSVGVAATVITLWVLLPERDLTPIITLMLGLYVPFIGTLLSAAVRGLSSAVDGMKTELMARTAAEAYLAGQQAPRRARADGGDVASS